MLKNAFAYSYLKRIFFSHSIKFDRQHHIMLHLQIFAPSKIIEEESDDDDLPLNFLILHNNFLHCFYDKS